MTWAAGLFLNTGSFGDVGEATSQLSEATGFNLTARVTRLLWNEDFGRKLLHLGLSYSHQFRDEEKTDNGVQYRARPESRLTDDRLVDTGEFAVNGVDLINAEAAMYSAKDRGRNNYQFYSKSMNEVARRKFELENRLHWALKCDDLSLCCREHRLGSVGLLLGLPALLCLSRRRQGDEGDGRHEECCCADHGILPV